MTVKRNLREEAFVSKAPSRTHPKTSKKKLFFDVSKRMAFE